MEFRQGVGDARKEPGRAMRCVLLLPALLAAASCMSEQPSGGEEAPSAVLVPVVSVMSAEGYAVQREFAGRVEAARSSGVGFEIGGRLADVVVDEGDVVARGAELARLDTARLAARESELEAALAEAEASLALAGTTLERVREALEFRGVSRQEYDEAVRAERVARSAAAAAAARLESVRVDLAKSVLRAPYDSTVTARLADEGQVLALGQVLLELQERTRPRVRIGVAGDMLEAVRERDEHTLYVDGRAVAARIRAVLPVRDAATRTVDVIFELTGGEPVLPGDIARLPLELVVPAPGFWVPLGSLAEGERGTWAHYVVVPLDDAAAGGATHEIETRTVEVLHEEADRAFVRGAITTEDRIVVDGLHRVVPGQTVRVGLRQARGPSVSEPD